MCDAYSFASAGLDMVSGIAGAMDARSAGKFEAAQIDAMKTLAAARASSEEEGLRREFAEGTRQNIAAMAISGFAAVSFEGVSEGNTKNLRQNMVKVGRNLSSELANLDMQKAVAETEAKAQAKASLYGGLNRAIGTMWKAEQSFQEVKTTNEDGAPPTRMGYLLQSFRS